MPFVDTTVFVAAFNIKDPNHQKGKALLAKSFEKFRWLHTSDYILDETLSAAWARTKKTDLILELERIIEGSEKLKMLKVDEPTLATAKIYLRRFPDVIPLLTDWMSLVLMRDNNISAILSFDKHFDKVQAIKEFSHIVRVDDTIKLLPHLL